MLDNSGSSYIHFGVNSFIEVKSVDVQASALIDSATISIAGADGSKAQDALTLVTEAIQRKDSARASFGYMMNRLESTNEVLNIQAENLMAAESRISDVDVATEMAALTRNQVLAQAGVAMLAQANTMPQMALTLLQG
jgi:flagellin